MPNKNSHWSLVDTDYNLLISKSIDQAADALGIVFAIHGSTSKQQLITIQLNIQAVNSIKKYRRIERYLTGLNAVESVKPLQIDGQSAVFEVALRSRENDFLTLIKNDAMLLKVARPEIKPQEIEPLKTEVQETEAQEIPDNQPLPDLQDFTTETADTNLETDQLNPVAVYYYQLLK